MFKKRFLIILVTVLALAIIGVSVPVIINNWPEISGSGSDGRKDHGYYEELVEFKFRITNYPGDNEYTGNYTSPVLVKYINQAAITDKRESNIPYFEIKKMAYIFEESSNNTQIAILIPLGIADNITMIPGEEYNIEYRYRAAYPSSYETFCLTIQKDENVFFLGLSDWNINYQYNLSDFIPITVEQTKILTDHYISGGKEDFWTRKTNTEIRFSLNGDSINLHQGQSGTLGDYDITLLIARETEYKPMCYDCGKKSISYVISKVR